MKQERESFPIFVVGCGHVGAALARACLAAGLDVCGGHCRTAPSAERASSIVGFDVSYGTWPAALDRAATVVLAVPDPVIRQVAEDLARRGGGRYFLHCSGARTSEDLAPLRQNGGSVASFHPLLSFADPRAAAKLLRRAAFAVEGDEPALAAARQVVRRLGGQLISVGPTDRVLYHGAAVMASNHLVALAAQAADVLAELGLDRETATRALLPLMESTLANLARLGLPDALTGPVSRGDGACVAAHLEVLAERTPSLVEAYRSMARGALEVAREQGQAGLADLARLEKLLRDGGEGSKTS